MSEIFGAVGSIAGAAIQADAVSSAVDKQIKALERQQQFVFQQLEPGAINQQAIQADIDQARNQLAAQALIDPSLRAARDVSSAAILRGSQELGAQAGDIGALAAAEAKRGVAGMDELKTRLIDSALQELNAGATLPPDLQAELVRAGLERTGAVTGRASAPAGSNILREVLGSAGIALKGQRQERAAKLAETAQGLEESRQRILGTLFPNLNTVQLNTLRGQQGVLEQADVMAPNIGLSGQDIANLWLSRVGATNQLAQQSADVAARGGVSLGQIWGDALGQAVGYGVEALPSIGSKRKQPQTQAQTPG